MKLRLPLTLIAVTSLSACPYGGEITPQDYYRCINSPQHPVSQDSQLAGVGKLVQGLFAKSSVLWTTPEIRVCWESDSFAPADATNRQLVREAIDASWGKVLGIPVPDPVHFAGWDQCGPNDTKSVHLGVADVRPMAKRIGSAVAGLDHGITLNFQYKVWGPNCSKDEPTRLACLRGYAIHEFGHVLGFAHEQNRPDAPAPCKDQAQGENGDTLVGIFDLFSIMNYCAPELNNGGHLSIEDMLAAQAVYYPDYFIASCLPGGVKVVQMTAAAMYQELTPWINQGRANKSYSGATSDSGAGAKKSAVGR